MFRYTKTIGLVFSALGIFLILLFMPAWCWIVLVGVTFIVLGIIIFKLSC